VAPRIGSREPRVEPGQTRLIQARGTRVKLEAREQERWNLRGAWRGIHHRIGFIFVAVSRSAADLLICGFLFVDWWLSAVDLELGSSGDAVKRSRFSEAIGRAWECVQAWILIE
jgi:hypothetical protein